MSKSDNLTDYFTDLGSAIRKKEGSDELVTPLLMPVRIGKIGGLSVEPIYREDVALLLSDIAEVLRGIYHTEALLSPQDFASMVEGIVIDEGDSYIPLSYIESTGEQYIDLHYVVKETDVIEMYYKNTLVSAADKFYFGVVDTQGSTWVDIYSSTGYIRFGQTSSQSEKALRYGALLSLQKSAFHVNLKKVLTLNYNSMPTHSLVLFANKNINDTIYGYGSVQCRWLRIKDGEGNKKIDLQPTMRGDGKIGLLDRISGQFYVNEGVGEDFVPGTSLNLPDGYELIDYVSFNGDKVYDAGYIQSSYSISCQFCLRATSKYVYGTISSPHTASVTLYTGSSGAWRWGSVYLGITTASGVFYTTKQQNGACEIDYASKTRSQSSAFTTHYPLIVGGYSSSTGSIVKSFVGEIYHFSIEEGDKLIADWYPCRNKEGEEFFWDNVKKAIIKKIEI